MNGKMGGRGDFVVSVKLSVFGNCCENGDLVLLPIASEIPSGHWWSPGSTVESTSSSGIWLSGLFTLNPMASRTLRKCTFFTS